RPKFLFDRSWETYIVPEQRGGTTSGAAGAQTQAQASVEQSRIDAQIDSLLSGRNADPFAILGPQPVETATGRRWVIRFYNPGAVSATVTVLGVPAPIEA